MDRHPECDRKQAGAEEPQSEEIATFAVSDDCRIILKTINLPAR
jgi:hypothetical protein